MEEQKLADHEISTWQWQSDPNPYQIKEEAKWTWQDYPHDICIILEKAFLAKEDIADLADYEIDLKKMIQVNKKDKNRVRRIRRQAKGENQSRFMTEMPEPLVMSSDPTMSQAFGTVQHFLEYMMKRTPESYRLYQSLKQLPLDSQRSKFNEIIEEVVLCIMKGAEAREKIIKTRSDPWNQNHVLEAQKIVGELQKGSENLRDFLGTILRIYTMETFVCYWLNELLRNDNWKDINVLTPYLVCLTYTFKLAEYTVKYEKGIMNMMLGYLMKQKLYLYRGSTLTREQFAQYDVAMVSHFSWNCVTSTSRSLHIALDFTRQSLEKAEKQGIARIGVIFVIKTDFGSIEDCEGMIDVAKDSKFPHEKEVILAPGTVFELAKTQLNKNTRLYEIHLKVRRKFEAGKGAGAVPLLGALQAQAISKDRAIVQGVPSPESLKLLQLLEGNKLIQEIEIRSSVIEEHVMEIVGKTRASTNLKKEDIRLIDNQMYTNSLSLLAYYFSEQNLMGVLLLNTIIFKDGKVKDIWKMKKLVFEEMVLQEFIGNSEQLQNLLATLKNEDRVVEISLPFKDLMIPEDKLKLLWESLEYLISLETFSLALSPKTAGNSDLNLEYLGKMLKSFKHIKSISLDLRNCSSIFDYGLQSCLAFTLSPSKLQELDLDLGFCNKISDKGLSFLNNGLALRHLSLNFMRCIQITDSTPKFLRENFASLISLNYLYLNFAGCNQISNKGLSDIKDIIMLACKTLKHLSLDFGSCNQVTDTGLEHLGESFTFLASLEGLSLEFWHCRKISDKGLLNLSQRLKSLTSLTSLSLAFGANKKVTYQGGIRHIESALISMGNLKRIMLDFTDCRQISDQQLLKLKRAMEAHTDLVLNSRSRQDFDPPKTWDLESLGENPFFSRAIVWGILIFCLCLKIFGAYLLYFFGILIVLIPAPKFISNLKSAFKNRIQQGRNIFYRVVKGLEERIPFLPRPSSHRDLANRQLFLAAFILLVFCIDIWRKDRISSLIYALFSLVAAYPAMLHLKDMIKLLLVLVCLTIVGCFFLGSLFEGLVFEKIYGTVYYSKNESRLQDAFGILRNSSINISGFIIDAFKTSRIKDNQALGMK